MPQQQVIMESAPMKEVERTDVVIVHSQQRVGFAQRNLYAMDVDRRERRNCYNYGGFGHMVRDCRNKGVGNRIGEERRLEYGQGRIEEESGQSNLKEERDLIVFD